MDAAPRHVDQFSGSGTFLKDWWADTWHHARDRFRWLHPAGAALLGFAIQCVRVGPTDAVAEFRNTTIWAGLGVVAWALLALLWNFWAAIPRIYRARLEEIDGLRAELRRAAGGAAVWRELESRFDAIEWELRGFWSYNADTGNLEWRLGTEAPEGFRGTERIRAALDANVHRDRAVSRFLAEATAAAVELRRMPSPPAHFCPVGPQAPADEWLNAVAALVSHDRELYGTGTWDGQRTLSGTISRLVEASKLACARLAAEDLPDRERLRRDRAARLSQMVTAYDVALNAAKDARFDEASRTRLDQHAQFVGDQLSAWAGPTERATFLSAPPYPMVYGGLPSAHAGFWQKHVGRMHHLRDVAAAWSR